MLEKIEEEENYMVGLLIIHEEEMKGLPDWLKTYLKKLCKFLEWWWKQNFNPVTLKAYTLETPPNYTHVMILTHEILDHPANPVDKEIGWADLIHNILYCRTYKPRFYTELARYFKRLTKEQYYSTYNCPKITHELSHVGYYELIRMGLETRDKTHDFNFFLDRLYYTDEPYREVSSKDPEWVFSVQKVK